TAYRMVPPPSTRTTLRWWCQRRYVSFQEEQPMTTFPEGRAIVYCEGALGQPLGKTGHGLVRRTKRYDVVAVLDSTHAGRDAREVLDGTPNGIPVCATLASALETAAAQGRAATHFVIGLARDGGRLSPADRAAVKSALEADLHV